MILVLNGDGTEGPEVLLEGWWAGADYWGADGMHPRERASGHGKGYGSALWAGTWPLRGADGSPST